jgi:hypothetical protein
VGALLATNRGIRRLLPKELAKAKGVPGDWISQDLLQTRDINHMTSLHLWAAVAASLDAPMPSQDSYHHSTLSIPLEDEPIWMAGSGDGPDWEWMAPDLSPGGEWHTA